MNLFELIARRLLELEAGDAAQMCLNGSLQGRVWGDLAPHEREHILELVRFIRTSGR